MTKYLISLLGLSALLLLHGCTSVPESGPQPAPEPRAQVVKPPEAAPQPQPERKPVSQPAVIYRPADTGVEWVTDTSGLESRHRFQLARHIVEVDDATRYYGGSVADIDVGARLRVVGAYRDDVVVADTIYIERSARAAPTKAPTETRAPDTAAGPEKPLLTPQPGPTPSVSTTPSRDSDADKTEQTDTESAGPERSAQPKPEKAKVSTQSVKPSPVAAEKEKTRVPEPPQVNPPSAKVSTQPSAAEAPSTETQKTTSPPAKTSESKLAKAEPRIEPLRPGATTPEKDVAKPAEPPAGAGPTRDFSQLVFDDRILPMSLAQGWTLDRQPDLVDGATRCVLLSPEVAIFDGYYPAKMWFRVNPVRAWVKTDSNIDASYPKQGLRVDGGALAPFAEELADEQTAYTDAPVLRGMAEGHTLTVALGFWPTWPKTKTQTASIDLAGFANAYAALRACSQQQQAARE